MFHFHLESRLKNAWDKKALTITNICRPGEVSVIFIKCQHTLTLQKSPQAERFIKVNVDESFSSKWNRNGIGDIF